MVPRTVSMSKRYPELTTITGAGVTDSWDSRTLVFWAASAGVNPVRIAASLRGKHEVAAVEATPERNRRRDNPLEPGISPTLPICRLSILIVDTPGCQARPTSTAPPCLIRR